MTCPDVRANLEDYRAHALPPDTAAGIRRHLDRCEPCWSAWNKLRWDHAAGTILYTELVEYLGDRFTPYYDSSKALADEWTRARPRTPQQVKAFYRGTDAYLYNQVIWHASGNRPHYVDAALPLLATWPRATILDYGCGIGEDTLALHRAGYDVVGCDLPSPPTDFFTWRAARHHYPHKPHPIDAPPTNFTPTILWIMDSLDHIPDLPDALDALLDDVLCVITEDQSTPRSHGNQGFHRHRTTSEVHEFFARHGLRPHAERPGILTVWTHST